VSFGEVRLGADRKKGGSRESLQRPTGKLDRRNCGGAASVSTKSLKGKKAIEDWGGSTGDVRKKKGR